MPRLLEKKLNHDLNIITYTDINDRPKGKIYAYSVVVEIVNHISKKEHNYTTSWTIGEIGNIYVLGIFNNSSKAIKVARAFHKHWACTLGYVQVGIEKYDYAQTIRYELDHLNDSNQVTFCYNTIYPASHENLIYPELNHFIEIDGLPEYLGIDT